MPELRYEVRKMVFNSFDTMVEIACRIEDVLKEQGILAKQSNNNNGQNNNNNNKDKKNSYWNKNKQVVNDRVVDSSQPRPEREIMYDQLQGIYPITCQYKKVIGLIPGVISLPYSPKNKTTSTEIVGLTLKEAVISTLE